MREEGGEEDESGEEELREWRHRDDGTEMPFVVLLLLDRNGLRRFAAEAQKINKNDIQYSGRVSAILLHYLNKRQIAQ